MGKLTGFLKNEVLPVLKSTPRVSIYGHRGAGGEAPENTIASCLHAMERGAKHLEIDVRLSADKQLVVIHDPSVNRTTTSRGAVNSFAAAELAKLDARSGGPPWPRKKDCGIPTLDALLKATSGAEGYFLEVKITRGDSYKDWVNSIAERFPTEHSAKKFVVTSLDTNVLNAIREELPHIQLGLLSPTGNVLRHLDDYNFEHLLLHKTSCVPVNMLMLKRRGIKVGAWTINDADAIKYLRRIRVDNIITDYPSMAVPLLASLERR